MKTSWILRYKIVPLLALVVLLSLSSAAHAVPETISELPYNQHDLETIQSFLVQENEETTNAMILGWDVDDPKTWGEKTDWRRSIIWVDLNGEQRIQNIRLSGQLCGILRITDCIALERIDFANTELTELILSNLPELRYVVCRYNELENLDFSNLPELMTLDCRNNQLAELELPLLPKLEELNCALNNLTELNLLNFPNLQKLDCSNDDRFISGFIYLPDHVKRNLLSYLPDSLPDNLLEYLPDDLLNDLINSYIDFFSNYTDFDNMSDDLLYSRFEDFFMYDLERYYNSTKNRLTELDLSKTPYLRNLECSNNKLTELDLSVTPELTYFDCSDNRLTILDLSVLSELQAFDCSYNKLTTLDLSNNPKLAAIGCSGNQLTELCLTNVSELQAIFCDYNKITELDLSKVPKLIALTCSYNLLSEIDLMDVPMVFLLLCPGNPFFETEEHIPYLSGFPDGTFRPDESITRAQAVSLFFRLSMSKNTTNLLSFDDVNSSEWYYQAVTQFKQYFGFSSNGNSFEPNKPITRAEFAQIAASFVGFETPVHVEDRWWLSSQELIDLYWEERIKCCIESVSEQGWMTGFPDGTFRPDEPLTRAQAVKVINMMLNRSIHVDDIPATAPKYTDLTPSHWAYADIMAAST